MLMFRHSLRTRLLNDVTVARGLAGRDEQRPTHSPAQSAEASQANSGASVELAVDRPNLVGRVGLRSVRCRRGAPAFASAALRHAQAFPHTTGAGFSCGWRSSPRHGSRSSSFTRAPSPMARTQSSTSAGTGLSRA
jgi:hypothetical protein